MAIKSAANATTNPDALMASAFSIRSLSMAKINQLRKKAQVGPAKSLGSFPACAAECSPVLPPLLTPHRLFIYLWLQVEVDAMIQAREEGMEK
jgi:hypothetical protein